MKSNAKSSITLPSSELKLVEQLQKKFKAKSKVEIIRRGLKLLQESVDREALRAAYAFASEQTKDQALEINELIGESLSE